MKCVLIKKVCKCSPSKRAMHSHKLICKNFNEYKSAEGYLWLLSLGADLYLSQKIDTFKTNCRTTHWKKSLLGEWWTIVDWLLIFWTSRNFSGPTLLTVMQEVLNHTPPCLVQLLISDRSSRQPEHQKKERKT